jgi:SAM-dependent methyltransferase
VGSLELRHHDVMPDDRTPAGALYDVIGQTYSGQRRTDPKIAAQIWDALGEAETVLNVGAGTGSYEPPGRAVTAVEPSAVMRAQRPQGAGPCIDARAEALPFADDSFDVAMAVLSDHHWADPITGLRELLRVGRRVVVFQWDNTRTDDFWLVRDYLPEFLAAASVRPSLVERARAIDAEMMPVAIPWDCQDGFFHCYWRRPHAYLQDAVRRGSSVWSQVGPKAEERAVAALGADLESRAWHERNAPLLSLDEADLGARLLTAGA